MDILIESLSALWKVLLVGLLLGAGLPAVFALGMRALNAGKGVSPDGAMAVGSNSSLGRVGAFGAFALVGIAVVFGIVVIVFGKQLFG